MTWLAPHDGSPGRPAVFSDVAIQFCLMIKVLFKLRLRQTTGMVASLLKMADLDWTVPDYSTLCRRQKTLVVQIPYRRADGPLNLLVDSTGIKFPGDGAWQARKHGVQGAQAWCSGSPPIIARQAMQASPGGGGRSIWPWIPPLRTSGRWSSPPAAMVTAPFCRPVLPDILDQIPEGEEIGTVTAPSRDHASHDPDGQWMAPVTPAVATPLSSPDRRPRSFRSVRTAGFGKRTARRQRPETKPCAPPATMAGRSGSAGPDTTPEAGSRQRCAASRRSGNASPREIPTTRLLKSKSASHS
jgi:hypothetical protein